MKSVGTNIKLILTPLIYVSIIILITFAAYKYGYSRYQTIVKENDTLEQKISTLESKSKILRDVASNVLTATDTVLIVLPEKQQAPLIIYSFKKYAQENGMIIEKLSNRSDSMFNKDISSSDIIFSGRVKNIESLYTVLTSIKETAPLITLNDIKATGNVVEDTIAYEIKIQSYWSALPTQITNLTEPISSLNEIQLQYLQKLTNYKRPEFQTLDPQTSDRTNPFN